MSSTKPTSTAKAATTGAGVPAKAVQAARKRVAGKAESRANAGSASASPPRLRLKLKTIDDVQAELARLYRSGKAGEREVADVSKLANILGILGRLIVDNDLAARLEALEEQQRGEK